MTREEAIQEIINLANSLQIIQSTPTGQAVLMAIKSLEAWKKIRKEIEDKIGSLDDELKDGEVCLSYYYGKLAGLSEMLEIIAEGGRE